MEGAGGEEGGERGERKTSERQTRGERRESAERGPAAVSAPAGIVCAARAPSPAPHGPATDTLRRSPAVSPCLCPHSPPKQASSPPGRAPRKKGGEPSGPGAPDTHPADPAEGRVLLIHFPLALARPGRQGAGRAGRKWALRSGGLSGTVRAPGGVRARAGLRGCREGRGEEGAGAPPRD